jgi:peptidoglycan hydrolase-like protein with peptidoglycan-binding domain
MLRNVCPLFLVLVLLTPAVASADELTQIIQKDLVALGYDPGNIQGDMSTPTIVAISKFQAENGLEVTGEASPQLAGIIKSKLKASQGGGAAAAAPATAAPDPAQLQAAQQACLQQKVQAAQQSQQTKRGLGSLMRAVSRTAARLGGDAAADIARASHDIYDANATAADLESAAKDLGISESDIEACRSPMN